MKEPKRPASVPPEAVYVPEDKEWVVAARDADGLWTGPTRWWRRDGTLCEESVVRAGKVHGPKKRFYEDGSVAIDEVGEDGWSLWRRAYRPKSKTAEPHPFDDVDDDIVEMYFTYTKDGWATSQTLLNARGEIVASDGVAAPPRPANVPELASFYTQKKHASRIITASSGNTVASAMFIPADDEDAVVTQYWEVAEWTFTTDGKVYRGLTTQYATDGAINQLRYTAEGETTSVSRDAADGDPLVAADQAKDHSSIAHLLERGAFCGAATILHAALMTRTALVHRLTTSAPTVAPLLHAPPPKRPAECSPDATWLPGLERFVKATVVNGAVVGEAQLWDKYGNLETWTYEQGRRVRTERDDDGVRYVDMYVATGPRQGELERSQEIIGDYIDEHEHLADGRVINRLADSSDGWRAERIEDDDTLVSEQWWLNDTLVATVTTSDEVDDDDEPLERFSGTAADGTTVTGFLTPGITGRPYGKWLFGKTAVKGLDVLGGGELVELRKAFLPGIVAEMAGWNAPPKLVADIVNIDWSELEGFFTGDPALYPVLLRGLASGNPQLALACMEHVSNDVLHQSTVSSVTGPMVSALLRIVEAFDDARVGAIIWFLGDVWSECKAELGSIPAIGGDTVFTAYVAAVDVLAKAVDKHSTEEAHENLSEIIADIRASDKRHALAKIRDAKTPLERSEAIFESHVHPQLVPADLAATFDDSDMLTRTISAMSAMLRFGKDAPRGTVERLEEGLAHYAELAPQFAKSRFADVALAGPLVRTIWHAHGSGHDTDRPRGQVPAIAALLSKVAPAEVPGFVDSLLSLSFGACVVPLAPRFMDTLEALARLFEGPISGEVAQTCTKFGLPSDGAGMRQLLETLRASAQPEAALVEIMHSQRVEDDGEDDDGAEYDDDDDEDLDADDSDAADEDDEEL